MTNKEKIDRLIEHAEYYIANKMQTVNYTYRKMYAVFSAQSSDTADLETIENLYRLFTAYPVRCTSSRRVVLNAVIPDILKLHE